MTHVAWVPPGWLEAAERTLEGMAQRHPSRTLILVPEGDEADGIDAQLSMRCFPVGQREICGEVVELHLRGERARAPASIVVPLAIADLPIFLRWRGEPAFGTSAFDQLVEIADRLIVDSSEWQTLRYSALGELVGQTAISDLVWARLGPIRRALAARWPEIAGAEIAIAGPPAAAALLRAWLSTRLHVELPPPERTESLEVRLDGVALVAPPWDAASSSDLLSAELDRFGSDAVYEQALRAVAATPEA
jgi:glucose-6-phosphate dehydrogenase assembly protein OpcA